MKAKHLIIVFCGFLMLLLASCQSEIDVKIPGYKSKLVVEGYIENGKPATVMLSRSVPFFDAFNYDLVMDSILIKDAIVLLKSSDGETERLSFKPYAEAPYRYAYVGNIIGKENTRYDLEIHWRDKVYTATTQILHTFDIDTIGFDRSNEIMDKNFTTIRLRMTDNAAEQNYYQFLVKLYSKNIRDRMWVTTVPVAFDDATINGMTVNVEVLRANPSAFLMPTMSEEGQKEYFRMHFRPGDTVYVKYAQMDYASYQFWNTGGNNSALGENPFTNPSPTITNIHGENVTGVWCGYAAKTVRLIYE